MKKAALAVCALSLFMVQAAFAAPDTKTVNCNQGKKIQDAVDSVKNGNDTIIDVSGICTENVVIRNFSGSSLLLTSSSGATINDASGGTQPIILVINSRVVTISKLILNSQSGIQLNGCQSCNVLGNTITISRNGVATNDSSGGIFDNTINLKVLSGGGTGVVVASFSNFVLSHNTISGAGSPVRPGFGLLVSQSSRAQINPATGASEITAVHTGIQAEAGSSVQLSGTLNVHDNISGVVSNTATVNIQGATISHNEIGLEIFYGSTLALFNSVVDHNTNDGVQVSDNSSMTLGGTSIQSNVHRGITAGNLASVTAGGPTNTVTGTTSGTDIACDGTSLVTGTSFFAPLPAFACANKAATSSPLP
jgi:hypothetical protein